MATAKTKTPASKDELELAINGRTYSIDLDDLTVDEIEVIEDEFDKPADALTAEDWRRAKMIRCIVYFLLRRDGQDVTMEDVREIRLQDISDAEGDEPRPTKPPSRAKPKG